jgi:hypothetical protein
MTKCSAKDHRRYTALERFHANQSARDGLKDQLRADPTQLMPFEPGTLLWRELPKLLGQVRTPFSIEL